MVDAVETLTGERLLYVMHMNAVVNNTADKAILAHIARRIHQSSDEPPSLLSMTQRSTQSRA